MLGKIFGVDRSLTYCWIRDEPAKLLESVLSGESISFTSASQQAVGFSFNIANAVAMGNDFSCH